MDKKNEDCFCHWLFKWENFMLKNTADIELDDIDKVDVKYDAATNTNENNCEILYDGSSYNVGEGERRTF